MSCWRTSSAAFLLLLAYGCTPALPLPEEEEPTPKLGESEAPAPCFEIRPLVWDTYPGIAETLSRAIEGGWSIPLEIGTDCRAVIELIPVAQAPEQPVRLAEADPSGIRLNSLYTKHPVLDVSAEECAGAHRLENVLVHELGHVFGFGDSTDRDDTMFQGAKLCDLVEPTDEERELAAERWLGR